MHLGDIRTAQKLWEVFPHDENTTDPLLKFAGGIQVPDDLFTTFQMEFVTDHRWGLWVQPQQYAVHPKLKRRLTLKPNPACNPAADAARLRSELERTRRRFQSPSRSQSPLKRRAAEQPDDQGQPGSGGRRQAEPAQAPSSTGRWWSQLLLGGPQEKMLATKDGIPLRILSADDLNKGAVIEITCATDVEAGPGDLDITEPRVFIVTKKGEHYLTITTPGEDEARICDHLKEIMGEVNDAVARSRRSVELVVDSIESADQTLMQLEISKAEADLEKAVASVQRTPAPATSSSEPHGSRQGEVQMDTVETPSEAPVSTTSCMWTQKKKNFVSLV